MEDSNLLLYFNKEYAELITALLVAISTNEMISKVVKLVEEKAKEIENA